MKTKATPTRYIPGKSSRPLTHPERRARDILRDIKKPKMDSDSVIARRQFFQGMVREMVTDYCRTTGRDIFRYQASALVLTQEALEGFVLELLTMAEDICKRDGGDEVTKHDIHLAHRMILGSPVKKSG